MKRNDKAVGADVPESETDENPAARDPSSEPPKVYIASCGTLCDVFWWARRRPE